MTNIEKLVAELKDETSWQQTPLPMENEAYNRLIVLGIRDLYIKTQRAASFYDDKFSEDGKTFEDTLLADEIVHVLLKSKILFFQRVQMDVNNVFGYSTDASSLTYADKPFQHLETTIQRLEQELRANYAKMLRFGVVAQGG